MCTLIDLLALSAAVAKARGGVGEGEAMRDQGARLVGELGHDVEGLGEVRPASRRRAVDDGPGELNLVQQQVERV